MDTEKKDSNLPLSTKHNSFLRITNSFILKSTIVNISTEPHLDGHYLKVETTDLFHNPENVFIAGINRDPNQTKTQSYRVKSQYINDVLDYVHESLNSDTFQPWNNNWNPDPKQKRTVKRKLALVVAPES